MSAGSAGRPIVIATRNAHKLGEAAEILTGFELSGLPEDVILPPEDGDTFTANALGKARAAHRALGAEVIADDSGIEAAALDGRPGVRSARYAGPEASDEENLALLLEELRDRDDRSVAYVCAIAHIAPDGTETVREARCEGTVTMDPRGAGGFGYDPAFVPTGVGDGRTMAELTATEKHAISHRGRALRAIAGAIGAPEGAEGGR